MPKFLVLKGCAGLGNRLFTIIDALDYCISTNRKLIVDWSDGQFSEKFSNVFDEFFTINHPLKHSGSLDDICKSNDCFPKIWCDKLKHSVYDIYDCGTPKKYLNYIPFSNYISYRNTQLWVHNHLIEKYGLDEIDHKKNLSFGQNVLKRIASYGLIGMLDSKNMSFGQNLSNKISNEVLIYADFIPDLKSPQLVKYIKLEKKIEMEIETWINKNKLHENSIGLHVRSTDKKPNSDINKLISYVTTISNDKKIFLSTDNIQVEKLVKKRMKNVFTYPKVLPIINPGRGLHTWGIDNSNEEFKKENLRTSIFDMWILSKCKTLFYQGNSSFSVFSKLIHNNKQNCIDWQTVIKN